MSFRVHCPQCQNQISPPFWQQYGKAFCNPSCASSWKENYEAVTVKEVSKKEYEIVPNNTFIHPDEKKILRSFASKMKDFTEPDDADTLENREFRKAIEVLDRISL